MTRRVIRIATCIAAAALAGCVNDSGVERETSYKVIGMQAPVRWTRATAPVWVIHDDVRAVTCWTMSGGYNGTSPAISCLPDSQVGAQEAGNGGGA